MPHNILWYICSNNLEYLFICSIIQQGVLILFFVCCVYVSAFNSFCWYTLLNILYYHHHHHHYFHYCMMLELFVRHSMRYNIILVHMEPYHEPICKKRKISPIFFHHIFTTDDDIVIQIAVQPCENN